MSRTKGFFDIFSAGVRQNDGDSYVRVEEAPGDCKVTKAYNAIVIEVEKAYTVHLGYLEAATAQEDKDIINNQLAILAECSTVLSLKGGEGNIARLKTAAQKDKEFPTHFSNRTGFVANQRKGPGMFASFVRKVTDDKSEAFYIVQKVIKYLEEDLARANSQASLATTVDTMATPLLEGRARSYRT